MNLLLLLAFVYLFTLLIGKVFDKWGLPWIFSSLLLGLGMGQVPALLEIIGTETFEFLAKVGMLMLLFLIGLEFDLDKARSNGKFIISTAVVVIVLESGVGTGIVRYFFHEGWLVSFLVAASFSTVGEAVLVPILDGLGMVNSVVGSLIVAIGTMDDFVEVMVLLLTVSLVDFHAGSRIAQTIGSLVVLFVLTYSFTRIKERSHRFTFHPVETIFVFSFFVLFLFSGVAEAADAAALGALMAGIAIGSFMPKLRLAQIEKEVKAVGYGFLAPLFLLKVGASVEGGLLLKNWWLVMMVVIASIGIKILSSLMVGYRRLGVKGSVLLGLGLSVKFSLSLVIISLLYSYGLIGASLYSVMIGSSVVFVLIVPVVFVRLLSWWGKDLKGVAGVSG